MAGLEDLLIRISAQDNTGAVFSRIGNKAAKAGQNINKQLSFSFASDTQGFSQAPFSAMAVSAVAVNKALVRMDRNLLTLTKDAWAGVKAFDELTPGKLPETSKAPRWDLMWGGTNAKTKFRKLGQGMTEIGDIMDDIDNKIQKNKTVFAGYAMSVMFLGMAIQRVFSSIQKFGTKTFNEIAHSVEGASTQSDKLDGSMAYLGFTIGQAFEPVLAFLIPIVDWFAELVNENESWVGWLIAAGIAIGTLLTLVGSWKLGMDGIVGLIKNIPALIQTMGTMFSWFGNIAMAVIGGIQKAFLFLAANPIVLLIAGLVAVISFLVYMMVKVGGFVELLKAVARGILRVMAVLWGGIKGVVMEIWNVIKLVWNWILEFLQSVLTKMLDPINKVLKKLGKSPITIDLTKYKGNVANFGQEFGKAFGDTMWDYTQWEQNSMLAPSKGYLEGLNPFGNMTGGGTNINISNVNVENPKNMEDMYKEIMKQAKSAKGV